MLALVDGEHYPPVVRDAIQQASGGGHVVAALLIGGSEKLDGDPSYGVPLERPTSAALASSMLDAARKHGADAVLDLSDEPVMNESTRVQLVGHALAAGLEYRGADFRFSPPEAVRIEAPTLAVIGTGKRVGKTAVAGHVARLLHGDGRDVVVVAMGRGGPAEPEVVEGASRLLGVDDLLARAARGEHAASDFLEDAALARVPTVGARRCGGGLLGAPFTSNVVRAATLAAARRPDIVLLEGSGAAIPPVVANRTLLVSPAASDSPLGSGFGVFRVLVSQLVVLTMCEAPYAGPADIDACRRRVERLDPSLPVIATVLRPSPVGSVSGRRVAYFTTAREAAPLARHLADAFGANVVLVSSALGDRTALRADLDRPEARDADIYLVEIKAAAIDVVAAAGRARGVEVVFCDNRPVSLAGEPDLDAAVRRLAEEAVAGHA
jgi:cyclic 2,3-diphosphoglycerate synthetase